LNGSIKLNIDLFTSNMEKKQMSKASMFIDIGFQKNTLRVRSKIKIMNVIV
jgi:hypothetical protein